MSCGQQIIEQPQSIAPGQVQEVVTIQFPSKIQSAFQMQKIVIQHENVSNNGDKSIQKQKKYSLLLHCKDQPKILDFIMQLVMNKIVQDNYSFVFERLATLNLNVNNIVSIQKLVFLPLQQLREAHLSMNKINNLKVISKLNFKNLTYFNICQNTLQTIDKISRSDFVHLEMFWTYDNLISSHQEIFKINSPNLNGIQVSSLQNVGYFMFPLYKKFPKIAQSFQNEYFQDNQFYGYQQSDFK